MSTKSKDSERVKFVRREGDRGIVIIERGNEYKLASATKIRDGQPVPKGAHVVNIEEPGADGWSECTTLMGGDGPPQVATPQYREGYDRIFGKKPTVGLA